MRRWPKRRWRVRSIAPPTRRKPASSKEIRGAGYNLKAAVIKKAISIDKASPDKLAAIVRAKGRPIPLIEYGARPNEPNVRLPVSVQVKGARKIIKHAFIAIMPGGHKGVFVRVPGAQHKKLG